MGDRSNIAVITNPQKGARVYLYGHWTGTDSIVHAAHGLRSSRVSDPSYLARIIFNSMTKGDEDGETGYGIDTERTLDEYPLIVIDGEAEQVWLEDNSNRPITPKVSKETFLAAVAGLDLDKYDIFDTLARRLSATK